MDKKMRAHRKFVEERLAEIAKIADEKSRKSAAKNLAEFHDRETKNFAHERQIHLLVTFFFALMAFGAIAIFVTIFALGLGADAIFASGLIMAILAILELFYVRYYYLLENGVAKLYALDRKIYDLS